MKKMFTICLMLLLTVGMFSSSSASSIKDDITNVTFNLDESSSEIVGIESNQNSSVFIEQTKEDRIVNRNLLHVKLVANLSKTIVLPDIPVSNIVKKRHNKSGDRVSKSKSTNMNIHKQYNSVVRKSIG